MIKFLSSIVILHRNHTLHFFLNLLVDLFRGLTMLEINIPGKEKIKLQNLVLDFNGTLAVDGELIEGVSHLLEKISQHLKIYIVTADTFGKVKEYEKILPAEIHVIPAEDQKKLKAEFVEILGANETVAIGNGTNDSKMLKISKLGIAVVLKEGASVETLLNADIVCASIFDALELLLNPKRIAATLRE